MRHATFCLLAWFLLLTAAGAAPDPGPLLYGTVNTKGGDSYTGPLRWDGEEVLWTDHFNAEKVGNEFLSMLAPADLEYLEKRGPSSVRRVGDLLDLFNRNNRFSDYRQAHSFVCRFGDIARLEPLGEGEVRLFLRNGESFLLADSSNDLGSGTSLEVFEQKSGVRKIRWRDLESVSFAAPPQETPLPWGEPIYGSVETESGMFRGYVQWDHDERVGSDVLDGDLENEDVSVAFADISAIEKTASGSKVFLKTGETLMLTGSNDVNAENRGIYVELANGARVDVPWSVFRRVEFSQPQPPLPGHGQFAAPARLAGSINLRNEERAEGVFAYDLDEAWNVEMLEGRAEALTYYIPFSFISRIAVIDADSVRVDLVDDSSVLLAHEQDVSERNAGLLVFGEQGKTRYVRWLDVALIEMRQD